MGDEEDDDDVMEMSQARSRTRKRIMEEAEKQVEDAADESEMVEDTLTADSDISPTRTLRSTSKDFVKSNCVCTQPYYY